MSAPTIVGPAFSGLLVVHLRMALGSSGARFGVTPQTICGLFSRAVKEASEDT